MTTIGILSDNHGDWPAYVARTLEGVDQIIHAGDSVSYSWVLEMEAIAPLTIVLGNMDGDLPFAETEVVMVGGKRFFVQHIVEPHRLEALMRLRLEKIKPDVVVFGHTHKPFCETIEGILFLNPGSVTLPRGGHKPSLIRLEIEDGRLAPRFIEF